MARILINSILLYFVYIIIGINGKISNKLVGGFNVFISDYRFQVSIRLYDTHHLCGGCIISKWHIITAASCVTSDVNVVFGNLKVLSGTGNGNIPLNDAILSDVAIVIIHPEYSPRNFWANDISILKLSKSLDYSSSVGPIGWPVELHGNTVNLYLIGWSSLLSENGIICKMMVSLLTFVQCEEYINTFAGNYIHQLCVIPKSTPFQIIEGDGGNPVLSYKLKNLIGIVSLITTAPSDPTIVTYLSGSYQQWMRQMMEI